jgi:ubiquinone/menaquinone biosynthesis C-methylase UbiE
MQTNYDHIAAQYKQAKRQAWRMHIEHFTFFELLGNLHGKSVLDLACGEGFFTRFLKQAGASRVVGVDISAGMIRLAQEEEARQRLGLFYQVHDVMTLELSERFDLVVAAYLLNYARTAQELSNMCQRIAGSLKSGQRFVTVNNNPEVETFEDRKYGFAKCTEGALSEGTPILWTLLLDNGSFSITNYHLSTATHESALRTAGFHDIRWHIPRVSPAGIAEAGAEFWKSFVERPPVIFLEATRN